MNSLAEIDEKLTPALTELDKKATPAISTTLKVTEEKVYTPLLPLIKYISKFLPVETTEKVSLYVFESFMVNLKKVQTVMLIKEAEKPEETTPVEATVE